MLIKWCSEFMNQITLIVTVPRLLEYTLLPFYPSIFQLEPIKNSKKNWKNNLTKNFSRKLRNFHAEIPFAEFCFHFPRFVYRILQNSAISEKQKKTENFFD